MTVTIGHTAAAAVIALAASTPSLQPKLFVFHFEASGVGRTAFAVRSGRGNDMVGSFTVDWMICALLCLVELLPAEVSDGEILLAMIHEPVKSDRRVAQKVSLTGKGSICSSIFTQIAVYSRNNSRSQKSEAQREGEERAKPTTINSRAVECRMQRKEIDWGARPGDQ